MSNYRTRQGNLMVSLTEDAHAYNREFFTLEITHMDGDEGIENDADVSGLSVFATQAQIDLYLAAAMAHATARCGQEGRVRNAAVYAAQAGVLAVGTCTTSKVGGDGKMPNSQDQAALADKAFADYDFGEGVTVTDTGSWEYLVPGHERSRKVYVETEREDDGPAPRWTLNFTVRFNEVDGSLAEAYALDQKGQEWGQMPEREPQGNVQEAVAPQMHEYGFDVMLKAAIRVKASSPEQAMQMLHSILDAADCNAGAWPNGDPVLFEASTAPDTGPVLYSIDGEEVANAVDDSPSLGL